MEIAVVGIIVGGFVTLFAARQANRHTSRLSAEAAIIAAIRRVDESDLPLFEHIQELRRRDGTAPDHQLHNAYRDAVKGLALGAAGTYPRFSECIAMLLDMFDLEWSNAPWEHSYEHKLDRLELWLKAISRAGDAWQVNHRAFKGRVNPLISKAMAEFYLNEAAP